MKPQYRKTPLPNRKLMSISGNLATTPPSIPTTQDVGSESQVGLPCESEPSSYHESQLWSHKSEGPAVNSQAVENEHATSTLTDSETQNTSSEPEYCNIDMEDALSVYDVYT